MGCGRGVIRFWSVVQDGKQAVDEKVGDYQLRAHVTVVALLRDFNKYFSISDAYFNLSKFEKEKVEKS